MTIDAPELTQVINLAIAVGIFGSMVVGFLIKLRSWQRKDVTTIVAPLLESQTLLSDQLQKLNSAVLGHESRLSFIEGKEAGRIEGWTMRDRGSPLKQIPEEEL